MVGFGGADRVQGGQGDDIIAGEGSCPRSVAQYCIPPGGPDGDDTLLGGPGDDRIDGDRGRDSISGQSGDDRLSGSREADRMRLGRGRDGASGGRGGDVIHARDGQRDEVTCGRGRDKVFADRRDRVRRSCERVFRRR